MNLSNKEDKLSQYIDDWNLNQAINRTDKTSDLELRDMLDTVDLIKSSTIIEMPSLNFQEKMKQVIQREVADQQRKVAKKTFVSRSWKYYVPLAAACALILSICLPYLFKIDDVAAKQISVIKEETLVALGQTKVNNPSVFSNGKMIGFERDEKITTWNQEDNKTKDFPLEGLQYMRTPNWSLDGHQIAFSGYKTMSAGIWVMNQDGSNRHQLTVPQSPDEFHDLPAWSPNGKSIAFTKHVYTLTDQQGVTNTMEIWIADPKTGEATKLTDGSEPSWSPNSRQMAYTKTIAKDETIQKEVWVINVDGTKAQKLTDGMEPSWSPDGQFIAYAKETTTHKKIDKKNVVATLKELWAINVDNKESVQLTKTKVNPKIVNEFKTNANSDLPTNYVASGEFSDLQPSWSKDGKSIVFVRDTNEEQGNHFSLMKIDVKYE